jgi:hypothetical protein
MRPAFRSMLVAALLVVLCSCGEDEQLFPEPYAPNEGANAWVQGILVRNAFIIGGPAGEPLETGADARLFVAFVNQRDEPDRLVAVRAPDTFQGADIADGRLEIPVGQFVGGGPAPQAMLTGATERLASGSSITVDLQFERAGSASMEVPVLPPSLWRTTYSPWPQKPAATPSPDRTPTPTPSPTPAPTPS